MGSAQQIPNIFMNMNGRRFGSWIDAGGRSNSFNEGDVVTTGAFQIESILRDELGLTSNEIDVSSFDLAGGRVSHFSLTSQVSAYSHCADVARECGLILFTDHLNKVKVVSSSGDNVHDFRLTEDDLWGPNNFKVHYSPALLVANEFILRYRYNYVRGSFDEEVEVSTDDNTLTDDSRSGFRDGYATYNALCAASRTMYNVTRKIEIEAMFLREKSEADSYLKQIINWRALRRVTLDAICPLKKLDSNAAMTTADIEIGDRGIVNHPVLPLETSGIAGTDGISDNALFVTTKVLFNPKTASFNFILRETPHRSQPTGPELGADPLDTGYGRHYGRGYGQGL